MKKYNIIQMVYPTKDDWINDNVKALQFINRGYALVDGNQEDVWELCNWSCYQETKPENLHSELTHCNSDIIVWIEGSNEYWAASPFGWKDFSSLEEAKNYMLKRSKHGAWFL